MRKIVLFLVACVLFSCQKENVDIKVENVIDPGVEKAQNTLYRFIRSTSSVKTKSSESEMKILSVTKEMHPITLSDSLQQICRTRSATMEVKDSAALYTFTFEKNNEKGFAIVSGDEKVPEVYAYVEQGSLSDTLEIVGFRHCVRYVAETFHNDIVNAYTAVPVNTRSYVDNTVSGVKLTGLSWGQLFPYNRNVPLACSSVHGGKAWAGCVPTALAMAVAYSEPMLGSYTDLLPTLNKMSRIFDTQEPYAQQIADIYSHIGMLCKVQYGCGGSSATAENASIVLSHYWMIHQLENGIVENWVKNCLNDGHPIIVFGSGHAWLIDGGTKDGSGNYTHFYMNWGYEGTGNGFFRRDSRYTVQLKEFETFGIEKYIYIFDVAKY